MIDLSTDHIHMENILGQWLTCQYHIKKFQLGSEFQNKHNFCPCQLFWNLFLNWAFNFTACFLQAQFKF